MFNFEERRAIDMIKRVARRIENKKRWKTGLLWKEGTEEFPASKPMGSQREEKAKKMKM